MATNHPDQVREGLWKTLRTLRDDWFAAQQGDVQRDVGNTYTEVFLWGCCKDDIEGELGEKYGTMDETKQK